MSQKNPLSHPIKFDFFIFFRRFMGWSEGGSHSRRKNIVTSILLCFGAGVLLATSFIHILPEVGLL